MKSINVRDARRRLKALLDRAAAGEEILVVRRGQPVARLMPPAEEPRRLPSLGRLRDEIHLAGEPLSREAARLRQEEEEEA
jgi:prevent-host-death family protein